MKKGINFGVIKTIFFPALQLAKLSGFSPIITTASLKHVETLKSLGATHVIDRNVSGSALASEISVITQNAPIKYVVDSISLANIRLSSRKSGLATNEVSP